MTLHQAATMILSDEYKQASAEKKRDIMWGVMQATPYESLPPNAFTPNVIMSYVKTSWHPWLFDAFRVPPDQEVRPPRTKSFNAYGAVGKVRYVVENPHNFTGFFETGGVSIIRMTLVMNLNWFMTGISMKMFVDGKPTLSWLMGPSLDPQNPNRDFFAYAQTNRMSAPRRPPFGFIWQTGLADVWMGVISHSLEQPIDHLASIHQSGQDVAAPHTPYQFFLTPRHDVHTDQDMEEDFRMVLGRFQTGTRLYDVYLTESKGGEWLYNGYIVTESELITSEFPDRVMAHKHQIQPAAWPTPASKPFSILKSWGF
jgi:hypothetical protein